MIGSAYERVYTVYCFLADLLRICCGPIDSCGPTVYIYCFFVDLLRICCGPVDSCGPTVYNIFSLRICCGPVDSCGPTVYIVFPCGSAADLLRARWFLRAHCLYILFLCGSAAGPSILAGPLFIIFFVADLLRICCGPVDSCRPTNYIYCFFADLLWICCGPVDSCEPTVYIYCFFADLLRICCGPVDSCGPTVYIYCFFADLLRICCAGLLILGFLRAHCLYSVYRSATKHYINSGPARSNGPAADPQRNTI